MVDTSNIAAGEQIPTLNKRRISKTYIACFFVILIFLGILRMSIIFLGPVNGQVIDAETGIPIQNVDVELRISISYFNPVQGNTQTTSIANKTDSQGNFKFPLGIKIIMPLFSGGETNLSINSGGEIGFRKQGENKKYEVRGYPLGWLSFSKQKITLLSTKETMTLDDCPEKLSSEDRDRCIKIVAFQNDSRDNLGNYRYLKYRQKIYRTCESFTERQKYSPYSEDYCDAILVVEKSDNSLCKGEDWKKNSCYNLVGIDLRDTTYCDKITDNNLKANCHKFIAQQMSYNGDIEICKKLLPDQQNFGFCLENYVQYLRGKNLFKNDGGHYRFVVLKLYNDFFQVCEKKDESLLPGVSSYSGYDDCRAILAYKYNDLILCEMSVFPAACSKRTQYNTCTEEQLRYQCQYDLNEQKGLCQNLPGNIDKRDFDYICK